MQASFQLFLRQETGATAIEYAFIASLIFLAIVAAVGAVGGSLTCLYQRV
jgi:pilus assembly protein Flp/PilA